MKKNISKTITRVGLRDGEPHVVGITCGKERIELGYEVAKLFARKLAHYKDFADLHRAAHPNLRNRQAFVELKRDLAAAIARCGDLSRQRDNDAMTLRAEFERS